MANHEYKILSEDAIKYLCGLIRDLASVSEGLDNINLADDKTFSNIYIKNLIDKCLEDANAEAEKLVGALTHLTCEETVIQPTLDNSEINVIYLYSANGNPPYQQFLKISENKLVDLGSTSISLEDYIKVADVAKDYATKVELKAVTDKIGTTTLTTTDTTITGAIEEVKGIADDKAEILDSEKNDVNTWSSNKIANEIAEVETELNAKLNGKADKNAVLNSLEVVNGNVTTQIIPWNDGTHYRGFEDKSSNTYTDIVTKDGVAKIAKIENGTLAKIVELATMDKIVPSTRLEGGFKVVAYSDRTITGNSKLECLENWVTNALSKYGDNLIIIGNIFNTPYADGFAIVNVWGNKKDGILGASGILVDQEGMNYYHVQNGVPGSGTLTKIN